MNPNIGKSEAQVRFFIKITLSKKELKRFQFDAIIRLKREKVGGEAYV